MVLGAAYQKGWLRLDFKAFEAAVKLNGVGVKMNLAAFDWGRRLVVEPETVYRAANLAEREPETLDQLITRRAAFLTDYQDQRYAQRYLDRIAKVRAAEGRISGETALTEAVAKSLFKLMAYKDEYEVARLYTGAAFKDALAKQFEGNFTMKFHLAPPIIAKRDRQTGHLQKQQYGGWMLSAFNLLAKAKWVRGTKFDPMGYTHERKMERALIAEFEGIVDRRFVCAEAADLSQLIVLARLPMNIKGYGHVKEKAVETYRRALADALAVLDGAEKKKHVAMADRVA